MLAVTGSNLPPTLLIRTTEVMAVTMDPALMTVGTMAVQLIITTATTAGTPTMLLRVLRAIPVTATVVLLTTTQATPTTAATVVAEVIHPAIIQVVVHIARPAVQEALTAHPVVQAVDHGAEEAAAVVHTVEAVAVVTVVVAEATAVEADVKQQTVL